MEHDMPEIERNLRRLQAKQRAASVQQNDSMPIERSHAAQSLSRFCFDNGIPTNSQSSNSPRERLASVNDHVPGSWPPFDYMGRPIKNNF